MKQILKMMVCVTTLSVLGGCAMVKTDEERNEVLRSNYRIEADGHLVINIEQSNVSANNTSKQSDVYVQSAPLLQTYRIEGRKIINCRWVDTGVDLEWPDKVHPVILWQTLQQLPNKLLEQNGTSSNLLENNSAVTITAMRWDLDSPIPEAWAQWTALQWTGAHEEVPATVKEFRQTIINAVSKPKYVKKYRSYLRAVPLFTKEALDAEKNTPLVKLDETSYHIRNAVRYPYLLIPVPEKKVPFPAMQEYNPGDKFKVQYYGSEAYYLIETFKGK